MKINIEPLLTNTYYHIYNRGINGESLFKEERNYSYFLQKCSEYILPIADMYAYCLLSNHFHMLIRTHSEEEIRKAIFVKKAANKEGFAQSEAFLDNQKDKSIAWIFGNEFSSLFKSYAQAINKAHKRTGGLFEEPFRRIVVDNETYFTELIYYIHHNPQKHGFVNDFRDYPHSSYHSLLHVAPTKLNRDEVIHWFGNKEEFENFHIREQSLNILQKCIIEFD